MWNVGPSELFARLTAQFRLDLEWILLVILAVGLILLGGFVIVRYKRWLAARQTITPPTPLDEYRALMEQGIIDTREFERIRDLLEKKTSPDSPPQPPANPGPPVI